MSTENLVNSIMLKTNLFPIMKEDSSLKSTLDQMSKYGIGVACFVNKDNTFIGILTDGDLRRLILTKQNPLPALLISSALEFGSKSPITVSENEKISNVIEVMDTHKIWDLPVLNSNKNIVGLLNRHNLERHGTKS